MWEYEVTSGDEAHVRMRASNFRQIENPSRILLKDLEMEVRNLKTGTFDLVKTAEASFDTANNLMYSEGDVEIRIRLPLDGSEPGQEDDHPQHRACISTPSRRRSGRSATRGWSSTAAKARAMGPATIRPRTSSK